MTEPALPSFGVRLKRHDAVRGTHSPCARAQDDLRSSSSPVRMHVPARTPQAHVHASRLSRPPRSLRSLLAPRARQATTLCRPCR